MACFYVVCTFCAHRPTIAQALVVLAYFLERGKPAEFLTDDRGASHFCYLATLYTGKILGPEIFGWGIFCIVAWLWGIAIFWSGDCAKGIMHTRAAAAPPNPLAAGPTSLPRCFARRARLAARLARSRAA